MSSIDITQETPLSFFCRPRVHIEQIGIGPGIPLGIERVVNTSLGLGGAYGSWGASYDNAGLVDEISARLGLTLGIAEKLNLAELGFTHRHHLPMLSADEHRELEIHVGARFLQEAAVACGWRTSDVQAVLLSVTVPVTEDYTERVARAAGIPESALKVSIHEACDGTVAGLNLALNAELRTNQCLKPNLAEAMLGKRILVGGIEGLSRLVGGTNDTQGLQLFGNAAGVIGIVPGQTMQFLAGASHEVYDEEGVLQVRMTYPHSHARVEGRSMIEVTEAGANHLRVAGLMHEPSDRSSSVVMAAPMGMVKLFVRNGVDAVRAAYTTYRERMVELGTPDKQITVGIVHHANLRINQLKEKHLRNQGICISMPWLLSDFGNVVSASCMIAFLRALPNLLPGDHLLFDGFGAGTYYDVVIVEL